MSMLTTAGPTRSAALTTVREYSSSSATSSCPDDTWGDSNAGPASDSFSKAATAGSWSPATLGILINKNLGLQFRPVNYMSISPIHAYGNVTLSLRLGTTRPRQGHA